MKELKNVRVKVLKPHTKACRHRLKSSLTPWPTAWVLLGDTEWRTRNGSKLSGRSCPHLWLVAVCNLKCHARAVIDAMDLGDFLALNGKLPK